MSTLQVANIQFESTGTNRIDFPTAGGNTMFLRAGNIAITGAITGNVTINRATSTVGQGVKLDVWGAINASSILVNGNTALAGNVQTFTSGSGNWTIPNSGTFALVIAWGGGGSGGRGGSTSARAAGGGGGGGASTAASGGTSVGGGAGGAASIASGTPGTSGSEPGGGGGAQGANGGSSGAGANGRIEIIVW